MLIAVEFDSPFSFGPIKVFAISMTLTLESCPLSLPVMYPELLIPNTVSHYYPHQIANRFSLPLRPSKFIFANSRFQPRLPFNWLLLRSCFQSLPKRLFYPPFVPTNEPPNRLPTNHPFAHPSRLSIDYPKVLLPHYLQSFRRPSRLALLYPHPFGLSKCRASDNLT